MLSWAWRDLWQRHRGRSVLLMVCLASAVWLAAGALLLSQALADTYARLLKHAPALVVRRVNTGGWAPLPADAAVACARQVPGAQNPRPRIWGVVAGPDGPLTVVGNSLSASICQTLPPPLPGQAVIGPDILLSTTDRRLTLGAGPSMTVDVIGRFPSQSALATRDVVWLAPADARHLLRLQPDQASDLAIDLFHTQEMQAIQADLAAAFPWPVHISDRDSSRQRHYLHAVQTGGMASVACVPALLALVLIVVSAGAASWGQRACWGLYKALGWTTADVARLHLYQATITGLPAIVIGLALAYAMVFVPFLTPILALWLPAAATVQRLYLSAQGAGLVLLEIAFLVGLPYLAAVFVVSLRSAAGDPWDLLQADR